MVATTFCTSGMALMKAGKNVSLSLISGGVLLAGDGLPVITDPVSEFILQAESTINAAARFNFSDVYTTLNDDTKKILEDAAASLSAIDCVTWDMSSYTSRVHAEDIITVRRDAVLRDLSIHRDKKAQDFVNGS